MPANTFELKADQVVYAPGFKDSAGRSMAVLKQDDGSQTNVLLEWRAPIRAALGGLFAKAVEDIPTDEDVNRPEEVRTLKIKGVFNAKEQTHSALVYECPHKPLNLRDVLLTIAKPSGDDRRKLAAIIATQIRSLIVHFRLPHAGLRPESFVFFGFSSNSTKPDLSCPYLLDVGLPASRNIYEHPEYQRGRFLWYYDVWALMMIISDIAEWRPYNGTFQSSHDLLQKKMQRKKEVMDASWKGERTAKIMQYGFRFIERDRSTLENLSKKEIKRFFDKLCEQFDGA